MLAKFSKEPERPKIVKTKTRPTLIDGPTSMEGPTSEANPCFDQDPQSMEMTEAEALRQLAEAHCKAKDVYISDLERGLAEINSFSDENEQNLGNWRDIGKLVTKRIRERLDDNDAFLAELEGLSGEFSSVLGKLDAAYHEMLGKTDEAYYAILNEADTAYYGDSADCIHGAQQSRGAPSFSTEPVAEAHGASTHSEAGGGAQIEAAEHSNKSPIEKKTNQHIPCGGRNIDQDNSLINWHEDLHNLYLHQHEDLHGRYLEQQTNLRDGYFLRKADPHGQCPNHQASLRDEYLRQQTELHNQCLGRQRDLHDRYLYEQKSLHTQRIANRTNIRDQELSYLNNLSSTALQGVAQLVQGQQWVTAQRAYAHEMTGRARAQAILSKANTEVLLAKSKGDMIRRCGNALLRRVERLFGNKEIAGS